MTNDVSGQQACRRDLFIGTMWLVMGLLLVSGGCQSPDLVTSEPVTESKPSAEVIAPITPEKEPETAQAKLTENTEEDTRPIVSVTKLRFDYGEIKPFTENKAQFQFSNAGQVDLKVLQVKGCCGAKTHVDKKLLAPGESATLSVTYKTGAPGNFQKQVSLYTNDPRSPRVPLTIIGKIIPTFDYQPRKLKLFPDQENAGCEPIEIKSLDEKPFAIKGFLCTGDCIRFDYDPNHSAVSHIIQPQVDLEALKKLNSPAQGRLQINIDRPDYHHAMVLFREVPKYVVDPPQIYIFNADPNSKEIRKISVLNNQTLDGAGGSVEIESISVGSGAVTILSQSKIQDGCQLRVEIAPPRPDPVKPLSMIKFESSYTTARN